MKTLHVVITRFCIRGLFGHVVGSRAAGGQDPLESGLLDYRLKLMEIFSSPALKGQTNKDFVWLVLVDPELSRGYRERLERICSNGTRVVLMDFNREEQMRDASWLMTLVPQQPELLITTNLDDDDAFSVDFISHLQTSAKALMEQAGNKLILYGSKTIRLWNLLPTRRAPLGTRSEWRRPNVKVSATGFSLAARYPEFPLTVLGMAHKWAENYLDFLAEPGTDEVRAFREKIVSLGYVPFPPGQPAKRKTTFVDLSQTAGFVVMANHQRNDQADRIGEKQLRPVAVKGPSTFPDIAIGWDAAREYIPKLGLPMRERLRLTIRGIARRMRKRPQPRR